MSPRAYSMERRAEQVAVTRDAIIDAATALYRERGIRATSMQEVARRADVAPGTVLNHFRTPETLTRAVLDRIARSLEVPTGTIFRGARSRPERIRRLVAALFDFYDRSSAWFEVFRGEFGTVPILQEGERQFWGAIQGLWSSALSPLPQSGLAWAAVMGLTSPATLGALRGAGLSVAQASEVIGDLAADAVDRYGRRRSIR